jgi:hypothetical protein
MVTPCSRHPQQECNAIVVLLSRRDSCKTFQCADCAESVVQRAAASETFLEQSDRTGDVTFIECNKTPVAQDFSDSPFQPYCPERSKASVEHGFRLADSPLSQAVLRVKE